MTEISSRKVNPESENPQDHKTSNSIPSSDKNRESTCMLKKKIWLFFVFTIIFILGTALFYWFNLRKPVTRNIEHLPPLTPSPTVSKPKDATKTISYSRRYDVYDGNNKKFIKKVIKFTLPQDSSYIKNVQYFVDPLLDSHPPEQYSYVEINTQTQECILNTRGGFGIPEGESWELIFKEKLGKVNYIMESTANKGNINGTAIDSEGAKIPISFGISWENSDFMDSCLDDAKKILSLLEYELTR